MRLGLEPASFDFICSVAALHHMGASAALRRMAELLRPGGRLVIVGCARIGSVRDLVPEPASMVAHRLLRLRREFTEVTSPTLWPPPETYGSMRHIARTALPGSSFRRRLLWRYTLTWEKRVS
jgi:SAM-dependent methyltransferase